jgi:hypothetical protein
MTKAELAHELRDRQYAHGEVPAETIAALSDEEIIWAYITCSCCGEQQVTRTQLVTAIAMARDADGFFTICGQLARRHQR